jgi:hypothetical protein
MMHSSAFHILPSLLVTMEATILELVAQPNRKKLGESTHHKQAKRSASVELL